MMASMGLAKRIGGVLGEDELGDFKERELSLILGG
jgi:hypothetical protein